jgi:hypothetical protein
MTQANFSTLGLVNLLKYIATFFAQGFDKRVDIVHAVIDHEGGFGLTAFYVPVLMRVGCCVDRTWGGRSVAESGPSSAANSVGVLYPIPLCSRS